MVIEFKYNRHKVKGEIIAETPYMILIKLHTNYYGKNVTWYEGENKEFVKGNIKNERRLK